MRAKCKSDEQASTLLIPYLLVCQTLDSLVVALEPMGHSRYGSQDAKRQVRQVVDAHGQSGQTLRKIDCQSQCVPRA